MYLTRRRQRRRGGRAERTVHRLMLEIADIRDGGVSTLQGMAQELTARSRADASAWGGVDAYDGGAVAGAGQCLSCVKLQLQDRVQSS